ncbi:MAG: TerB N-terminal domain-containing protein [Clostridia bacterium]|nr:TerB N-terminal domain-containing protein [Clostridia bacterium]
MKTDDGFWTLDEFAPKKTVVRSPKRDVEAVEITFENEEKIISSARELTSEGISKEKIQMRPSTTLTERIITAIPTKIAESDTPDEEYESELRFIGRVKLFRNKEYNYYESFLCDGRRLFDETREGCPYYSYFSYVPQYSQLSSGQLDCYLDLRRQWRAGEAPKAEYSYLLLYVSELINVDPDTETVPKKIAILWQNYRHTYPKLDSLIPEWITDYCLLTRVMPPKGLSGELEEYIFSHAALRELFFSGKDGDVKKLVDSGAYTTYDYRKSKFATKENLPIFEQIIPAVVAATLRRLGSEGKLRYGTGKLNRHMFTGLLCTPWRKCRLEVDYISLSRSHEVRYIVTDAVKHAENKIRAYLGIKSRLTVYSLPTEDRKIIDSMISEMLGGEKKPKAEEEKSEYSHLYDLPKHEFSLDAAKKIEEDSWQTTERLIEAFEEEAAVSVPIEEKPVAVPEVQSVEENDLVSALSEYIEFVRAARDGDFSAQRAFADSHGLLAGSIADRINEISADILGDILLEECSSGYKIIEDYAEEIKDV